MPVTRRSRSDGDMKAVIENSPSSSFAQTLSKFHHVEDDQKNTADQDRTADMMTTARMRALPKGSLHLGNGTEAARTPSPAKKRRTNSQYAPPAKYAHLKGLQDIMEPGLIAIFVGFNPGVRTAQTGHPYAHPSNSFWKLLHSSGLTDRRWRPDEAIKLPSIGLGNTNLVERPSKNAGELSKEERAAGAPVLAAKVRQYRPEAVCIVGKSIWEDIWRYKYGRNPKPNEFKYGWQDEEENMGGVGPEEAIEGEKSWAGAKVFVTTSTSGLSASLKPAEKEAIWKPFGEWVQQRRRERD